MKTKIGRENSRKHWNKHSLTWWGFKNLTNFSFTDTSSDFVSGSKSNTSFSISFWSDSTSIKNISLYWKKKKLQLGPTDINSLLFRNIFYRNLHFLRKILGHTAEIQLSQTVKKSSYLRQGIINMCQTSKNSNMWRTLFCRSAIRFRRSSSSCVAFLVVSIRSSSLMTFLIFLCLLGDSWKI